MKKKYGAVFTSVNNPEEFSKMWESVIKVISLVLSMYLSYKGVESAAAAQVVSTNVSAFTLLGGAFVACWEAKEAVFGAVRKLVVMMNA